MAESIYSFDTVEEIDEMIDIYKEALKQSAGAVSYTISDRSITKLSPIEILNVLKNLRNEKKLMTGGGMRVKGVTPS